MIDVSFVSVAKVLGPVLACAASSFDCLALVKPQFEVGRERVGKGGVVRDGALRRGALVEVGEAALALGATVLRLRELGPAGTEGQSGDVHLAGEAGRDGALVGRWRSSRRAAREVEP